MSLEALVLLLMALRGRSKEPVGLTLFEVVVMFQLATRAFHQDTKPSYI